MIPEIKRLHSPDITNLKEYKQPENGEFCFLLQIIVTPKGVDGEESFDVIVCSLKWLDKRIDSFDIYNARHHLIIKNYNYDKLLEMIKKYCNSCVGNSWNECAMKLGRLGKWEFEDYKEL